MDLSKLISAATPGQWTLDAVSKDGKSLRFKRSNDTTVIRTAAAIGIAVAKGFATVTGNVLQWNIAAIPEPEF